MFEGQAMLRFTDSGPFEGVAPVISFTLMFGRLPQSGTSFVFFLKWCPVPETAVPCYTYSPPHAVVCFVVVDVGDGPIPGFLAAVGNGLPGLLSGDLAPE